MRVENVIYNVSAGFTTCAGFNAMKDEDYQPRYFYFHFILIVITAITVGFFAVTMYKNYLKKRERKNDRMGTGHF